MLRIESRCSSFSKKAVGLVSALAGHPGSSISALAESPDSSLALSEANDLAGMEHEEANLPEEASAAVPSINEQIAQAFGPLSAKVSIQQWEGRLHMCLSKFPFALAETDSDILDALSEVRRNWIRLMWIKQRDKNTRALSQVATMANLNSAKLHVRRKCGSADWKLLDRSMNQALDLFSKSAEELALEEQMKMKLVLEDDAERHSQWWHDLQAELCDFWWTDLYEKRPQTSYTIGTAHTPKQDACDIELHIAAKLRDRCKANPSAPSSIVIEVGSPLDLVKSVQSEDVIRYAALSMDPQETWVKISDATESEKSRRTLVFPFCSFGAALNLFFSENDTTFENLPGYVPMEVWLLIYSGLLPEKCLDDIERNLC